jgi:5-methylcytosine-specific restriction enzyme A
MLDESIGESIHWKAPIDITKEQWMSLLRDEKTITEKDLRLLKAMYDCSGCKATSIQLARLLGMSEKGRPVNLQVGKLGQKIIDKLNISWPKEYRTFNVPFSGERRKRTIYWILRPELQEAIWEIYEKEASSLETTIPEEIDIGSHENLYEGAKKQIYVNGYERNRGARERCIKHYGMTCVICGFDFEKMYGEVGRDVIHVHHLKPLSEIGDTYRVDPIRDLRPVCPNCHVIIHKNNPAHSIDEVRAMIKSARIE